MKKVIALLLAVMMVVALCACGQSTPAAAPAEAPAEAPATESSDAAAAEPVAEDEPVELSIAHIGALESPSNLAVEYFIKLVSERSNGSITVINYPASQLGADRDVLEGVVAGTIDMGIPAAGISALFMPEYYIFDCPYMFSSQEHLKAVVDGELGQELADKFLAETGVRVLAQNWNRGTRQSIFAAEVTCAAEYKDVKIRLPEIDSYLQAYKLLGSAPTIIAFNETYSSLQQGIVDGMECPLDWIYDNAFYEVCKNLVIDNHVYSIMTMVINDAKFQSLSENQRQIIAQAAIEAGEYENQVLAEKESGYIANMEAAGVKVSYPDIQEFIDVVAPALPDIVNSWGDGLYEKVMSYK